MTERLRPVFGSTLLVLGFLSVALGAGAYVQSWYATRAYAESGAEERAAVLLESAERPTRWIDTEAVASETPRPASLAADGLAGRTTPRESGAWQDREETERRVSASEIELIGADLLFFDPPEPGAHARLGVQLRNRGESPSELISLGIPPRWFQSYEVIGAIPSVTDVRAEAEGLRYFDFPAIAAGATASLELHVTAIDEELSAPEIQLGFREGALIAQARPDVAAPKPRPGPARLVSIPRLGIKSSVMQTAWEPLPFIVGQINGSAHVTRGNTVLIGHLGGPSGNVFANLDRIRPGDEVVAMSRGLEYRFIVSDSAVLPNHDSSPTQKTESPRLTLMTCTGRWNPLTNDYSHRLWVIAEPLELARETIAAKAAERERLAVEAAAAAMEAQASATGSPSPDPVSGAPPAKAAPAGDRSAEPAAVLPPVSVAAPPLPRNARPAPLGMTIAIPSAETRVPRRLVVKGTRPVPTDESLHSWLLVRSDSPDSHWYVHPREVVPNRDGIWEAELELGGPSKVRHELRLGVVDDELNAFLNRHVAERPGEPLAELPERFWQEESRFVVRE